MLVEALCGLSKNSKVVICIWHSSAHYHEHSWDWNGCLSLALNYARFSLKPLECNWQHCLETPISYEGRSKSSRPDLVLFRIKLK